MHPRTDLFVRFEQPVFLLGLVPPSLNLQGLDSLQPLSSGTTGMGVFVSLEDSKRKIRALRCASPERPAAKRAKRGSAGVPQRALVRPPRAD